MKTPTRSMSTSATGLPVVVSISFAGSRVLFDRSLLSPEAAQTACERIEQHLTERLRQLPQELGLSPHHFVCGLSQLAIGADTAFTQACQRLGWLQHLLLPQRVDDFLQAKNSEDRPDFDEAQAQTARELLASKHIVQVSVVAHSLDRHERFDEVNRELVQESDVVVCLVSAKPAGKAGGTLDLLRMAEQRGRTALVIRVAIGADGLPQFEENWHRRERFAPSELPRELANIEFSQTGLPDTNAYCQALRAHASDHASKRQKLFKQAALVIILTHVLATVCAVAVMALHGVKALPWLPAGLPWLLAVEVALLLFGFYTHRRLHHSHTVRDWALLRLVSSIAKSVKSLREVPVELPHLFSLPLPPGLQPLLRTLSVLRMRETHPPTPAAHIWKAKRDDYVAQRLTAGKGGQIGYFERELKTAETRQRWANRSFVGASSLALLATLTKLAMLVCHCFPGSAALHDAVETALGSVGILLPIVAVAALSLAASFDLEARVHTYAEMLSFLRTQKDALAAAQSPRSFGKLALETETRLLGETASWYSRRAFTSVT